MVHSFHHPRGGDTTYGRALTGWLQARGHEVAPLAARHPDNEPSAWETRWPSWVDPLHARGLLDRGHMALRMAWSRQAARATADLVASWRPDIAHVQHLHHHLSPSVLQALHRAGVPVVWTVHDYELICPSGLLWVAGAACERCRGHHYQQAVLHRCKWGQTLPSVAVALEKELHHRIGTWQLVDRYLCPSRYLADTLVRFGLPQDRVMHLPNALDRLPEDAAARVDEPGEGWLYAGRLTEEKGPQVALQAARRLPHHRLLVVGSGPFEAVLRDKARDLPWVRFLGQLPRAELARLLPTVRAVAVPSLWPENLPYAVLEAQAAGRAVVASAVGGIPEQIDDGVDGRLVPPGDPAALARALAPLLSDADTARALGRAGRARVARDYAPQPHVERIEEVYLHLLRKRGRAPGASGASS